MCIRDSNCNVCQHEGPPDGPGCMVFGAHLVYNYDQLKEGNEEIRAILNMLIPMTEDGLGNKQCRMFLKLGEWNGMERRQENLPGID